MTTMHETVVTLMKDLDRNASEEINKQYVMHDLRDRHLCHRKLENRNMIIESLCNTIDELKEINEDMGSKIKPKSSIILMQ